MTDTDMYDANGEITNHALLVKVMTFDLLANYEDNYFLAKEYNDEVLRRFGPDALENSAQHFTGWHYSSEEILQTAIFRPEWLERLMRNGSRDCCSSVKGDPHGANCRAPEDDN